MSFTDFGGKYISKSVDGLNWALFTKRNFGNILFGGENLFNFR